MQIKKSWNEWLTELKDFITHLESGREWDKDWLVQFYDQCLYTNNDNINNQIIYWIQAHTFEAENLFHKFVSIEQITDCYIKNEKFYNYDVDDYEDVPFLSDLYIEKWHIAFINDDIIFDASESFKEWLYYDMLNVHYSLLNEDYFGNLSEQVKNTKDLKTKIENLFKITNVKSEIVYWYCSTMEALPLNILETKINKIDKNIIMSFLALYFGKNSEAIDIKKDSSKKYKIWKKYNNELLESLENMWMSCLILIDDNDIEKLNESARLYGYIKFENDNMKIVDMLLNLYNSKLEFISNINIEFSSL